MSAGWVVTLCCASSPPFGMLRTPLSRRFCENRMTPGHWTLAPDLSSSDNEARLEKIR